MQFSCEFALDSATWPDFFSMYVGTYILKIHVRQLTCFVHWSWHTEVVAKEVNMF
jgi:hypothetical protein